MKLLRVSLKDQAADILRDQIISGEISPGSKLVEREVAELLGISRAPARDALMQLEKEGLVVSQLDARYVIELTERDIRELHAIRLVLERLAVDARQLTRWHTAATTDAERIEVERLLAIIPEIRPLMQRQIALATELDTRARTGAVFPRKKWRH